MSTAVPFSVKSCSLAALATGEKAGSLYELREKVAVIDEGCLYFHFWGGRMTAQFVHGEHHNDFAAWAYRSLHDHVLAERLTVLDPREYETLEELRQELLEILDERLEEYELILSVKREDKFHFIWSTIVIFDTTYTITHPKELLEVVEHLPPSSFFYHFIDARRRTPERMDDFSTWLKNFGPEYTDLITSIRSIDPYFLSLVEVKNELIDVLKGGRK